ncbi:MAG: HAMP domain-containing histidine kinase [Oscillospiraceae bacterium]|nr:HAMP domain-containing histidine kinase [Oscillospiraceae bacterium]
MLIYTAAVILAVFIAWLICRTQVWYDFDITYRILNFIEDHIIFFTGITIAAGWLVIFSLYVYKLLGFLDKIIVESEKLTAPESDQIRLPADLKGVQDELNNIRERAARDSAAAKEAEQRKNDLVVYLAHDLKTPLTSVIGYLSLMQDEPQISTELRAKYTGIALEKAGHLEELINEFFDITRFNLTHISLELENVNFTRLVEQTAFEFEPILKEKGLLWKLDIDKDTELLCDANKMERVLDNIIRNAVNYSYPNTEIALTLQKSNEEVVFSVKNKGRTISEEKLGRIFEQFYRLDTSRGTRSGGAGLGLAIAKEITELHGGTIKAESSDESVTFTVEIPM